MPIRVGDRASHDFVVNDAEMAWFQSVSRDHSRIHTDEGFARERGFEHVIVYGGIMLAHLSHVLGTKIPGTLGASVQWTINYRKPLYVGEPARIDLEVVNASRAVGLVEAKFKITSHDRTVATGSTQSVVPIEEIAE